MKNRSGDKISTYFYENKLVIILVTISGLCFDGLMCFIPLIQGKLISAFEASEAFSVLLKISAVFLGLILFVQISRFFKRYIVRIFASKMIYSMRTRSLKFLLNKKVEKQKSTSNGDIMNRILADIDDTSEGVRKITTEVFDSVVLMLGYFISMCFMDIYVSLATLPIILLAIFSSSFVKSKVAKSTASYKIEMSGLKNTTIQLIENETELRILGAEKPYDDKFNEGIEKLEKKAVKSLVWSNALEPLYNAVALLGVAIVVIFGGKNVISGIWDIGAFSAFLVTYVLIASKAGKTGKAFNSFMAAKISWIRVKPYLAPPVVEESSKITSPVKIIFDKVSFNFNSSLTVTADNLSLNSGEIIGVTGGVHSGKSTFLGLLSGLYEYSGSVKVNGEELSTLSRQNNEIGYMQAEPSFFTMSVEDNIALGRTGNLDEALSSACIYDEILALPYGKSTIINTNNVNLSGGQQKRVALARAVFGKPKIILLDDPFNALNIDMQEKIMRNLKDSYKDSIIFIATNMQEVLNICDKTLRLEKGAVLL